MRLIATAAIAILVGCTPMESSTIQPGDMIATLTVTTTAAGWSVLQGDFSTGNGCILFAPSDVLKVTNRSESNVDIGRCSSVDPTTSVSAPLPNARPGDLVTVSLFRGGTSTATSTMTIPQRFTLNYEQAPSSFSRSQDDYTLTWDNAATDSEPMTWTAEGACITTLTGSGTTSVSIPKGTLKGFSDTCDIHIVVKRTITGTSGFSPSSQVTAVQQRGVTVESRP